MPELPEVETVCRGLAEQLRERPLVTSVKTSGKKLRVPMSSRLDQQLRGHRFVSFRRRAKYILIETETSTIISHLGMTGSWRLAQAGEEPYKHDHCKIALSDGRVLIYHDPRRFGFIIITNRGDEQKSKWLKNLGVEPLSDALTAEYLFAKAKNKHSAVKTFIMDQKIVVGVGNIYASEALFHAKVKPQKLAHRLKLEDWRRVVSAIQKVLGEAIAHGGTTLRDYRNASGEFGEFQKELFVYGRDGEKCKVCGATIRLIKQTGRSTYLCRDCQK